MDAALPTKGCVGEGCTILRPWPLHHVRHLGAIRRLCTSCVLKSHPGSFCTSCLGVFGPGPLPPVAHCFECPSVCHLACLPNSEVASRFLCPCCSISCRPFSYYPTVADDGSGASSCEERWNAIEASSARPLLAAAKISAVSVSRAAVSARQEADRKLKEAIVARKRAWDMLERALLVSKIEREKVQEQCKISSGVLKASLQTDYPSKRRALHLQPKAPRVPAISVQSRIQSRESEKRMKLHEPMIPMAASVQDYVASDAKNPTIPQLS